MLCGFGNAIVPQVAYLIFQAIAEACITNPFGVQQIHTK